MGEAYESAPFLSPGASEEREPAQVFRAIARVLSVLLAVCIGVYAGVRSSTAQESWIYSTVFCAESLLCAAFTGLVPGFPHRRSVNGFALNFLISAALSPLSQRLFVH
jgi:hypothetical protein